MDDHSFNPGCPRVSVVTVVRNAVDSIAATIESVLAQTYSNLEYIVVDGNSTDGTQKCVQSYRDHITHFVSEPDEGVSDAFNKGIALASGDLINFMNADDCFYAPTTIEESIRQAGLPASKLRNCIIYGDTLHFGRFGESIGKADHSALREGCSLGHQASFVGSEIFKSHRFDVRLPLAMDYDFWLRCLQDGSIQFHHVDVLVARCRVGGISGAPSSRERAFVYGTLVSILNGVDKDEPATLLRAARVILATRVKLRIRDCLGAERYRSLKKALFGRQSLGGI